MSEPAVEVLGEAPELAAVVRLTRLEREVYTQSSWLIVQGRHGFSLLHLTHAARHA